MNPNGIKLQGTLGNLIHQTNAHCILTSQALAPFIVYGVEPGHIESQFAGLDNELHELEKHVTKLRTEIDTIRVRARARDREALGLPPEPEAKNVVDLNPNRRGAA